MAYSTRADVTAGGGADVNSSPAIAADGTVYVANEYGYVYAFRPDGTLPLEGRHHPVPGTGGSNWSSFAIGGDGTLYIGRTYGVWSVPSCRMACACGCGQWTRRTTGCPSWCG